MAVHVLRDAKVFIGSEDLSGQIRQTGLEYGSETLDATTLGSSTRKRAGGLKTVRLAHEGFMNPSSSGSIGTQRFTDVGASSQIVTVAAESSDGGRAYFFRALHTQFTPRGGVGELYAFGVTAEANAGEGLLNGRLLRNSTAVTTGSSAGTAVQMTASSSTRTMWAALHVITATSSGTQSITVQVQSDNSSTFPSPTTVLSFTATTAPTQEMKSTALGSTDTWFRQNVSASSSNSIYQVAVAIGFTT